MRLFTLIIVCIFSLGSIAVAKTQDVEVKRNGSILIQGYAIYDSSTCQSQKVKTRIRRGPKHGQAEAQWYASEFNNEHRCAGKVARRAGVLYKPDPGFVGTDEIIVNYSYANVWGREKTYRFVYKITVK